MKLLNFDRFRSLKKKTFIGGTGCKNWNDPVRDNFICASHAVTHDSENFKKTKSYTTIF